MMNNKDFIWNLTAGLINASEAVILLAIITRTNGLEDAGILTISFAIGNLFMTIGKYGMRTFQVTDVINRYSFSTYLLSRFVTVFVMCIVAFGCVMWNIKYNAYSKSKALCVFLICAIYMIESLEDVFWGGYQKDNHLEIGAKLFCYRWMSILLVFGVILISKHDLLLAAFFSLCGSCLVECILLHFYIRRAPLERADLFELNNWKQMVSLLYNCLPLCLISFLNFYILNAPKYAIDRYLSDELQACYGFISMPVFVVGLLNSFIYQPQLVKMACEWKENRITKFMKRVKRQFVVILGLIALCEIGAFYFGIFVLSWLYNTDLSSYKNELLLLLFGGGILAIVGYLSVILTLIRKQKEQLFGYGIIAIAALGTFGPSVRNYGIMGAVLLYLGLMIFLALMFMIYTYIVIAKR